MDLSPKQKQILLFSKNRCQSLICHGAVRSGKTSVMGVSFILWAMKRFSGANLALCGRTVGSTSRNIINPLKSLSYFKKYGFKMDYSVTKNMLTVSRGRVKNYFYVFGGKDEGSAALIQGMTLGGVLFDEVALMPRSFVEQALARCSVEGAKFWFNCNPESPNHWFYKEWILDKENRHKSQIIHFLMEDNPSLSKNTLERYKTMYTGVFYQRFILGRWKSAEGLIYRGFADNSKGFLVDKESIPRLRVINIGVDFGGNRSSHAFVAVGLTGELNKVFVLRSRSIPAKGTGVQFIVREFLSFAKEVEREFGFVSSVYADSAEQAIINSMRASSSYVILNSIKNKIIDRIRCTDMLISKKNLFLLRGENQDLIGGLENACWDLEKMEDTRLDDGSSDIDILDSFEYAFEPFIRELLEG